MFAIVGTPSWANGGQAWNTAPRSAIDLRRFARRRRHGATTARTRDEDGNLIPRVRLWIAWNEPNNPVFLKPQYVRSGRRTG